MQFKSKDIANFWDDPTKHIPKNVPKSLLKQLYRKLQMLNAAASINDLRVPPGNRLEMLTGDRIGQYSIRVNNQWRLCFYWQDSEATEVDFCDYHK